MGIPGLTSYIENRSERYLEPFDLHDTYLVIDGYSIACQLYVWYTKSNCAFGGDYDKYAKCIRKFFGDLLKCNITPLVLLDGSSEEKKLQTKIKRAEERIQTAGSYTPLCQNKLKFFPALLGNVFIDILKEMNIRHVQCLFEADNDVAAVAKFLNCPVLSYDSDFYIYGPMYIPFSTMDFNIIKKCGNHVKYCKIYRIESLLNAFPGLDKSVLPLAAILLGNDYIESNVFIHFYQHLKLPKVGRVLPNKRQCRIEATFHWLSRHTLNSAMCSIIKHISLHNKQIRSKIIKIVIDQYSNVSTNILIALGFSKEEIARISSQNVKGTSSIETNTKNLKIVEGISKVFQITFKEKDESKIEVETLINSLPRWYIEEYYKALLPTFFMNLLLGRLFFCRTQIEDYRQPSSSFMSEKIMNVIFTLLTLEFKGTINCAKYLTRGEDNRLTEYQFQYTNNTFPHNIPSLHNLRDIPLTERKQIFDLTLGVKEQIDEFPINWRLYIATATYWVECLTDERSDSHIYALLFTMLYHVIDAKIGYCRSIHKFQAKYEEKLLTLESKKLTEPNHLPHSTDMSISQALDAVVIDDCILLAPFFINNSEIDQKLYTNPKKFKISVVHVFAIFQHCIEYSFNLNALLGFPYEITSISRMYNGTLLYNLYNKFYKRKNIEDYINLILKRSPTFLQLFNIILIKAKLMFKVCSTK